MTICDLKFPWQVNVIMSPQIFSCVSQYEINFENCGECIQLEHQGFMRVLFLSVLFNNTANC